MPVPTDLVPVRGAWVRHRAREEVGRVLAVGEGPKVEVQWNGSARREWLSPEDLRCGFQLGMHVQDVPRSRVRRTLGEGIVVETRELGGRDQVLVEFPWDANRVWLPYENLRHIKGVDHRFLLPKASAAGQAERLRLRSLAYALDLWNENTGSLSHLDIDPLPHQIHLVHHILASGNLNWLIADDVGLGKTIEVGMLLAALQQRGLFRRILLVTPAGLTQQWKDELRLKFGMDDFRIYGRDFNVEDPREWKLYDHVIGSIDRFKAGRHREMLLQAGPWDLIVFDEAHRLSRRQFGSKLEAADRFKLAADLRELTDALFLLSATPHQGMPDKFKALLELLRPEWKPEIDTLELNPRLLRHMVIRNHKADVTDAEGNFIFHGKLTRAVQVEPGPEAEAFDRALRSYLRRGYAASERLGRPGRAIGFVMTVYRKLAASSVAAIHAALERRLRRLLSAQSEAEDADEDAEADARFAGEREERRTGEGNEFFAGEAALLEELIERAAALLPNDRKLAAFLDNLIATVLRTNPDEKLVIFTEYRATQDYLASALREHHGAASVEVIHGSLDVDQRREAIARFEDAARFLVSTEAGGEGINLHRRCHVMVNYDLPWNPMRLVQRIGRLYRYGQEKRVVVFNVHALQTLDARIMNHMYYRIDQVVQDLAVLGGEFNEGLADDILGELADLLEVEEILEAAEREGESRTHERIEEALARAREAVRMQHELFEHVTGYDPNEVRHELKLTGAHVQAFAEGMFRQLGVEVVDTHHKGLVWDIRLPEEVAWELPGRRSRWRVTFDRVWGASRPEVHALDLGSPLMRFLLAKARDYEFGGHAAALTGLAGAAVLTAILRWQDDQGRRMRQELTALQVLGDARVETNPPAFADWLLEPTTDGAHLPDRTTTRPLLEAARDATERRLAVVSNADLHPESRQWVSGGWLVA